MRVLITGGSGFIGTAAMNWALQQDFEVVNFDINPPKKLEHNQYWKHVDIRNDQEFIDSLIEFGPTHIWHLAAKTGMDIKNISDLDANTKAIEFLIRAVQGLSGLRRVLFTSSLLVCRNGYVPSSDMDYCPPNLYGESKVIGEKLVRESNMSCQWVIVRPTSIWGPWFEHSYRSFFKAIDRGVYFQPAAQPIVKPLSFVGNTVYMMQKLLFQHGNQINGKTYYLGDYPENSIQDWADLIQKELGKGKTPTPPFVLMKLMAKAGDLLKKLGWRDPPITSFRLHNMLTAAHYPIEKTQDVVGSLPYSLEEGVRHTLTWMHEQKLIQNKPVFIKTNGKQT